MIISASKKTDIPAYYSEWFMNRIKESAFYTVNAEKKQYYKWHCSPENVEAIVFWSKNPEPMLSLLSELEQRGYPCLFNFTLTPYTTEIEKGLNNKKDILRTFLKLSGILGAERVVWHYAPVFFNAQYDLKYHIKAFDQLARVLSGHTKECKITFIKDYVVPTNARLFTKLPKQEDIMDLACAFAVMGLHYNIEVSSCMETIDLSTMGIEKKACIEKEKIEKLIGEKLQLPQRNKNDKNCNCIPSFDIGTNLSCLNNCEYCCEGNNDVRLCKRNYNTHNKKNFLLLGDANPDYKLKRFELPSLVKAQQQISLFV